MSLTKALLWMAAAVPAFGVPAITTLTLPDGMVQRAYNATLTGTGTGTLVWTLDPPSQVLPAGISFTNGTFTGSPTLAGTTANIVIRLTDGDPPPNNTITRTFSITVREPLVVTTGSLPNATVGVPYNASLAATGGLMPYVWAASGLPPGLAVNGSAITGTPTTSGTTNTIALTVNDNNNTGTTFQTTRSNVTITIGQGLTITTPSLPGWTQDRPYPSQTLAVTGATGAVTWALAPGSASLPTGLTLSTAGVITGTPTAAASSTFTIRATDSTAAFGEKQFTILINAPPVISTATMPSGTRNVAYTTTLAANGGTSPFTWSVPPGTLPAGLTLTPSTGVVSGTPTAEGTSQVTFQVADAAGATNSKQLSILINPSGFTITTTSLPNWTQGILYNPQSLTTQSGTGTVTWSLAPGSAQPPTGLTLSTAGVISGTPSAAGSFPFTVRATDSSSQTADKAFTIVINVVPTIATALLSGGNVNVAYSASLTASGGTTPLTWSIATGALPNGLSLNPTSGAITGTPSVPGTQSPTFRVTDAAGAVGTKQLSIAISSGTLTISTTSLPNGVTGQLYPATTLTATGGTGAGYSWSITGGTPVPGLTLSSGGLLTGTPTSAGTFGFTVQVADSGANTTTRILNVIVVGSGVTILTPSPLPQAVAGIAYTTSLSSTGGSGTGYQYSLFSGSLPAGIVLGANGQISGVTQATGSYSFVVQVNDSIGTLGTKQMLLHVAGSQLSILTASPLADGFQSVFYNILLQASGGSNGPYSYQLASGLLPPGISLGLSGSVSGTPSQAGAFNFTVQVTDGVGGVGTKPFSLTVNASNLSIISSNLPAAVRDRPYTTTLVASGGQPPYTWTFSAGALPTGLTLSTAGVLSGTPTVAGTFNFLVNVRDLIGLTSDGNVTLQVVTFGITSTTVPNATSGVVYNATLAVLGGSAPYTWSVTGGTLPQGITLSAAGVLSGTTSQTGAFNFTVTARDSNNLTTTQSLTLTVISSSSLSILTASLPGGTVGTLYDQTLQATGGAVPYTWLVTSGVLPPGVTLTGATGQIRGTPLSASGSPYSFTVQVTDNGGATAQKPFSIAITGANVPVITTTSLPNATPGTAYNQPLGVSGGTAPYTWTIIGGALPSGINLSAGGVLSGTATQSGSFQFTVRVADVATQSAPQSLTLTVAAASALTITTISLPNGTLGTAYTATMSATGGAGSAVTWSLTQGSLPPGLLLIPSTGTISGTPTAGGTFGFIIQASDSISTPASRPFSINIGTGNLAISTPSLPNGSVGVGYTQFLSATGGSGTGYQWDVINGQLPLGLTLTTGGVITGTPASAGSFTFTVRVRDSVNAAATQQLTITVTAGSGLAIINASLPNASLGVQYSQVLQASGGLGPYTWTISAGLPPPGLTLGPTTGLISGTPLTPGGYQFTVRVQDSTPSNPLVATREFIMTVGAGLTIASVNPPNASIGSFYNFTFTLSGGTAPFTWLVTTGAPPPGINLATSGLMTGTPTITGTFTFTVQVSDGSNAVASRVFTLQVNQTLSVTTTALPGGSTGLSYSQTLASSGGTGLGYTWLIISGSLPAGLTLTGTSGVISGSPTSNGTSTFTVQVNDSGGGAAQRQLSITIGTALTITTTTLPNAATGAPYNQTVTAAGGSAPLQWNVVLGNLPPGLTLNASTGTISGTASASGNYPFTIRVQDAAFATSTKDFTIVVALGLSISTPTALPTASENSPYGVTLAGSGGAPPYVWSLTVGSLPAGLSLNTTTGGISGTPALAGNYSFIVQITDSQQQTLQKAFTLVVAGRLNILTPPALPNGTVRTAYIETLVAAGGAPPYTWALAPGGTPPIGITIDPPGTVSGTPTSAGVFSFTAQVTDSTGASTTRTFTLTIVQGLVITTVSPLPAGTAGAPYAQPLAVSGGQQPYVWSASGGMPPGLNLNAAGILTGTPTANGTFTFTAQVTDNASGTASAAFTIVVRLPPTPPVTLTGITDTVQPAQQPRVGVSIGAAYPVPVNGTLTLAFTPDAAAPSDDPAVVFTNGRRTVDFTIPANATQAQLPDGFAMQTGTVAGSISLMVTLRAGVQDITPAPAPVMVGKISRATPSINSVRGSRVSGGLQIDITGYSTSREIVSATFRFQPAPGSSLQTTELTVQLSDGAQRWYQSDASKAFGSQFTLTQQFSVAGDTSAISSVSVTLANAQGQSQSATANFQ